MLLLLALLLAPFRPATAMVSGTVPAVDSPLAASTVLLAFGDANRCTGSLIAPRVILTAAHCFNMDVSSYLVIFTRDVTPLLQGKERFPVRKLDHVIFPPTRGQVDHLSDDLALAFLTEDAPAGVPFAKLPDAPLGDEAGAHLRSLGFGLQNAEGRPLPMLPSSDDRIPWEPVQLREKTFVSEAPGADALAAFPDFQFTYHRYYLRQKEGGLCSGDSGGPVFLEREGQAPVLAGVNGAAVKLSRDESLCASASLVTRLDFALDWIRANLP